MYLPHWPIPSSFEKREIDYETVFLRMKEVLAKLENPHTKMPPVIHVTGTNGKGSVIAFLAAILQARGLTTHIYTSPHLHDCNERIVLSGEKISDNFLLEIMEETRIATNGTPLSFFEGFTIGAFLAFSKIAADVVLIETGMGARIDATNIIEKKLATIITPISFDHTEYLGESIAEIAMEKSYIIKPLTPVVIGPQPSSAKKIIELVAKDQKAKIIRYDEEFSITLAKENNFDFQYFSDEIFNLPSPSLAGQHQYINASIAIATLLTLPFGINQNHIKQGLKQAKWPSRLEKINDKFSRIIKNSQNEIFIDGAHNQGGAFALARFIEEKKTEDLMQNLERKNFIICGFTKNKCKKEFLQNFLQITDKIAAVRVDGEPNPEDAEKICEIGQNIGLNIAPCEDLLDAISFLAKEAGDKLYRIIICGSLHLARDVKKYSTYCSNLNLDF